jgi:protein-disulfide isomerase
MLSRQQSVSTFAQQPLRSGSQVPPVDGPIPSTADAIAEAIEWQPPVAQGKPSPFDSRAALPIVSADHVLGSQHAPVTFMLFGDFQCEYAMHSARALVRRVQEEPSQYRVVWRHRPLDIHTDAKAIAAESETLAAQFGELAFWRFLYAASQLRGAVTHTSAKEIARSLSRGAASVAAQAARRAAAQLDSDERIAVAYAVNASPTVFLNGFRIEGDMVESEFDSMIDEEEAAVRELLQEPVPQAKVYSIRVHANLLDLDSE